MFGCNFLDGEYLQLSGGTRVRSGYGIHLCSDGTIYMGNWENDLMNGSGRVQFSSGAIYEGEFLNNCFHGKGQYIWPNGSRFDGEFSNNRCNNDDVCFVCQVFCSRCCCRQKYNKKLTA